MMTIKKAETMVKAIAPIIKQYCQESYDKKSQALRESIQSDIEVMWLDYVEFKDKQANEPELTKEDILAITRKEMENFEIDIPATAFDDGKQFVTDYVKALKDELNG